MQFLTVILFAIGYYFGSALATPMLYKKNINDKYEAELIPVSSTVIPLSVYEVSYGFGGRPSEEYKMAYLKKLRSKLNPDTLITANKKLYYQNKAKVMSI